MKYFTCLARGAAAALTVLALAACNRGTPGCTLPPQAFNLPVIVNPTLISPAPGATGVSTGPLDVTIGSAFNATMLFVQDGNGNLSYATNFRLANPPATDVRIGTFAQLASQTTYKVYANVPVSGGGSFYNPCGPNPAVTVALTAVLLGSFTTR